MTENNWEKRWHPLREEWVVYSAHRNSRPWQGAPPEAHDSAPEYDPDCYLCPGGTRISGKVNPKYSDVFIFENDHPVVGMDAPPVPEPMDHLYRAERAHGIAKVVCYDPRHNVSLAEISLDGVVRVFESFREEMKGFAVHPEINHVLIFENKGEVVGVSNPHPHCQIYATDFVFKNVEQQLKAAARYRREFKSNLFDEIVEREQDAGVRVIAENGNAIAFVPYFARYAYEVMIFPKQRHADLTSLSDGELHDLSRVFQEVVRRMDMNFNMNFPYVMSVMQAPVDGDLYPEYRMHLWFQPPYRQPGLVKYLAGPEIGGGNFMADTIPEEKAAELRNIDLSQYKPVS